jgi:signal transduction histidine kinase
MDNSKEQKENYMQQQVDALQQELAATKEKLAEAINKQKEFIYIAAHDLQSPVRKLNLYLDKLIEKSKTVLNPDSLFYINRIKLLGAQMTSLVEDISVLTDLKKEIRLQECDLNKVLQNAIEEIKTSAGECTFTVEGELPVVNGNAVLLKDLFAQLFANAVIFRNETIPLQINISAELLSNEERDQLQLNRNIVYQKITVADNGSGFEQQYSEQIFDPFFKLQGNSIHNNSGMGLAICKLIAEKHYGTIYAKGEKNLGAQFILILPAA